MMGFDLIAYHTLLKHVYKKELAEKKDLQNENVTNLNIKQYKDFMSEFFGRVYLDEEKKLDRLMQVFGRNFHEKLINEE